MNEEIKNEFLNESETANEAAVGETAVEAAAVEEIIPSMDEFKDELNQTFKKHYTGDIVDCTIITVTDKELMVNMGYASDGIIPVQETFATEDEPIMTMYHEGDKIKAEITRMDDGDGNVLLSVKRAEAIVVWDELETKYKEGLIFPVKVKEVVKGGVVCDIKGVRAFIPASQVAARYVEDLSTFVGQTLAVKVNTFSRDDKKVVLSRRVVEEAERAIEKSKLLSTIKKGDRLTGTVVKLMNFGAFVELGGIQGLIHNQDLSWSRIKHPSEVVKEGDQVEVTVLDIDVKTEKIGLGLKDVKDNPWSDLSKQIMAGHVYTGTVERLAPYGAFVKISEGVEGLVHISEISDHRIGKPEEVLTVGDKVQVKILEIDTKDQRIKMSIKEAANAQDSEALDAYNKANDQVEDLNSLESVFKVFLKDIKN